MNTQLMVKPSSLMRQRIIMVEFGNIYLFRFTDELQSRMEELLERKKVDLLTADEIPELAGIIELSRIVTLINA
jgi:NADH dehydrogenase FAD-containing subunit